MSRNLPPGFSVDLSGAARVAGRRVRGLGMAVPIDFKSTETDENELVEWYRGRSDTLVRAIQLRREREGPYFHQFIVFELQHNGGLFRIDRRLRPDEDVPLNSLKDEGIPAFDTIEPIVSWDDPLFVASDCLISIEFKVDVYLALILKICRAIQAHPLAKVYTLQRYNCYFFAQTMVLCMACGTSNWAGTGDWLSEYEFIISQEVERVLKSTPNSNKDFLGLNGPIHKYADDSNSRLNNTKKTSVNCATEFTFEGHKVALTTVRNTTLPAPSHNGDFLVKYSGRNYYTGIPSLRDRINDSIQPLLKIYFKAEQAYELITVYKYIIGRDIWEIPIKEHLLAILPKLDDISVAIEIDSVGSASNPAPEGRSLRYKFESFGIRFSPDEQLAELRKMLRSSPEAVDRKFTDTCLNSFEQNMVIQVNYGIIDLPQGMALNSNMEDIPRFKRAQKTIFLWRRAPRKKEPGMTNVTILEMQKYLAYLIHAHSVRVEQYIWATNAVAADVARDIKSATNDIWKELIPV